MIDTLVYSGGDVKALGAGRVGGILVRWGSPEDHDIQGDFFGPDTYFGATAKGSIDIFYNHGLTTRGDELSAKIGNDSIGEGAVKATSDGLWFEGTLAMAKPGVPDVYKRIESGEMGFSSGSAARLVKREAVKAGVYKILRWPLVDVTVSATPVEPRNKVLAIKSLINPDGPDAGSLVDRAEALVADVEAVVAAFRDQAQHRASEGRALSAAKREAVKAMRDTLDGLIGVTKPRPTPEQVQQALRLRAEYLRD